jgi:hypothetical protein
MSALETPPRVGKNAAKQRNREKKYKIMKREMKLTP